MTEVAPAPAHPVQERKRLGDHLREIEFDPRMIGMVAALAVIWLGFNWLSDGAFLTPRNLWNLLVQTASIAIMACGMVLVIVTRNIDLSVGSMLGFVGMMVGLVQVRLLPELWGLEHPLTWLVSLLLAMTLGGLVGLLQGALIAYLAIPSFIVTLGGLLVWRGAAWWVTQGQTIAPMDSRFRPLGGGVEGAIGTSASWAIGIGLCAAICLGAALIRRRRKRFGFVLRPLWAEIAIVGLGCAAVLATVMVANAYALPAGVARRLVEAKGGTWPEGGLSIGHGLAVPVLVALAVGVIITFLANRLRFGRYVFAIGGNPEAAQLSGVKTRKVLMLSLIHI